MKENGGFFNFAFYISTVCLIITSFYRESVVLFDGSLFMAGYSTTMKESQMDAVKKSFTELKRTNFQLIITEKDVNSIQEFLINEDENAAASQTNTKISTITKDALTEAESKPPVGDDGDGKVKSSFAMKMMKKMGWAGAGLGAQEQGITAPIEYVKKNFIKEYSKFY